MESHLRCSSPVSEAKVFLEVIADIHRYCVGTRRHSLLNQSQIDRCLELVKFDGITNYESRMVAEVELYWIIYNKCGRPQIDLEDTKLALQSWQREWTGLYRMFISDRTSGYLINLLG